ncbi:reverse transcriptase domain, Reverse transcriptase zinc-binding domain protein [Artemisia annua]|uniref:Reverse transcriptase domain, Reverse transcriptase zinc-binding domain protein n=1 Tax=Artemisia annua TaxID=35608 RepID=A0A2U1NR45_ARTAN|nr:reverse transcriptase domain, Reverse transcriptase zinc-binding domain protein [Artemisia annua]
MFGIDLHSLFKKKIGNGSTTRFWLDRWVGNAPLCFTFPRLFQLDSQPQCYVSDRSPTVSSVVTATNHVRLATGPHNMPQNINSQQLLRSDAEKDELLELESLVSNLHLSNEDDKWECLLDGSRVFSVKGMRKLIINSSFPTNEPRTRWNKLVPIKVNIASWRMENQRIPTRVNLDYRGIDLHSVRCPVCDDDLETEEHILVKCVVAKNTWAEILKWWNIHHIL